MVEGWINDDDDDAPTCNRLKMSSSAPLSSYSSLSIFRRSSPTLTATNLSNTAVSRLLCAKTDVEMVVRVDPSGLSMGYGSELERGLNREVYVGRKRVRRMEVDTVARQSWSMAFAQSHASGGDVELTQVESSINPSQTSKQRPYPPYLFFLFVCREPAWCSSRIKSERHHTMEKMQRERGDTCS